MGLGSNSGDSRRILMDACEDLRSLLGEVRCSSLYRTKPRYVEDQPDFLNMALCGTTAGDPEELLRETQRIEAKYGRSRDRERIKGPRTLDVDILLFGDTVLQGAHLSIPHPGITERAFVLVPLIELDAGLSHPASGVLFSDYFSQLPDQGIYPLHS